MSFTSHGNAILRLLPEAELERLNPFFKTVPLASGQPICGVDEPLEALWFPERGAASRLVQLLTGETVETGIVGNDGVIGLPLVLGGDHAAGQCTMQIEGSARLISAADFAEHVRGHGGPLLRALLMYANLYISILSQIAACHGLHRIEQRLSRCILTLHDYAPNGQVRVTHDTLAEFLGVHRPSITYALQALASSGAIALERRCIVVEDRNALVEHACECYANIRKMTRRELERIREDMS